MHSTTSGTWSGSRKNSGVAASAESGYTGGIIYPNLALLYLGPKFLTVFAGVPIDDATGEVLMDFEPHIAEYRKMRRRKLAALTDVRN